MDIEFWKLLWSSKPSALRKKKKKNLLDSCGSKQIPLVSSVFKYWQREPNKTSFLCIFWTLSGAWLFDPKKQRWLTSAAIGQFSFSHQLIIRKSSSMRKQLPNIRLNYQLSQKFQKLQWRRITFAIWFNSPYTEITRAVLLWEVFDWGLDRSAKF